MLRLVYACQFSHYVKCLPPDTPQEENASARNKFRSMALDRACHSGGLDHGSFLRHAHKIFALQDSALVTGSILGEGYTWMF